MDRFERISDKHSVDAFRCGNTDLDDWLVGAALNSDRSGTARVYLWLGHSGEVIGYFAITPHTIRREGLPRSVARGSPDVIPGYLLARLAVAESAQGRGNGGRLLVEALRTTLEAIRVGGGRVIVVDAIDDHAHTFYEHFGFKPIPETGGRLVMKAGTAAASVGVAWPKMGLAGGSFHLVRRHKRTHREFGQGGSRDLWLLGKCVGVLDPPEQNQRAGVEYPARHRSDGRIDDLVEILAQTVGVHIREALAA